MKFSEKPASGGKPPKDNRHRAKERALSSRKEAKKSMPYMRCEQGGSSKHRRWVHGSTNEESPECRYNLIDRRHLAGQEKAYISGPFISLVTSAKERRLPRDPGASMILGGTYLLNSLIRVSKIRIKLRNGF